MSITDTADTLDAGNGASESSVVGKAVPTIDLLSCQPEDLASHLLTHRFRNNAMEVASFLLTCTAALPNAEEISAQLMGGGGDDGDDGSDEAEDTESAAAAGTMKQEKSNDTASNNVTSSSTNNLLGEPMASFSAQVSCINPRGRFLLSLHNNGLLLTNPKKEEEQITVTRDAVQHMIWFRKPEDYKSLKQLKEGKPIPGHMVLLCLEDGITFRNKALKQICLQLPSYPAPSAESAEDDHTEEDWYNGFSAMLSKTSSIIRVMAKMDKQSTDNAKRGGGYMFQAGEGATGNTSSTTEGLPFVGCNRGFNNGALFPLREGLLFFKPPLFVPRSKLASISCGRGSGQSRFVDMVVQLDNDESSDGDSTLEFTNIDRDELQGLNSYIHNVLIPAMKIDAAGGSDNAAEKDEDDDEEDVAMAEVVDSSDEGSDSDESSGKNKRKSSRAASRSAREATRAHYASLNGANNDDDDDEEDSDAESFNEEEDSDDGSDDDGSDDSDSDVANDDELEEEEEEEEEEESDDSGDGEGSFEEVISNKKARFD